jgi:hypothetical protein
MSKRQLEKLLSVNTKDLNQPKDSEKKEIKQNAAPEFQSPHAKKAKWKQINFSVPEGFRNKIKIWCIAHDRTMGGALEEAFELLIAEEGVYPKDVSVTPGSTSQHDIELAWEQINFTVRDGLHNRIKSWCLENNMTMRRAVVGSFELLRKTYGN